MNTVKITFEANGQELKVTSNPALFASNTVDYIEAEFTLGDNWSFQSVRAIWVTDFECIATVLDQNGKCIVPQEVLTKALPVKVNLVGSDVDNNELVDRLTTYPIVALVVNENAKICGTETAPITPSQFEQFIAIVNEKVDTVRDITSCVLNPDYTLTINYSDGTSDTVGPIRGAQGETGNGISKIEKTNTSGLVDTYRITYTDGTHTDYTVTNGAKGDTGNGIQSIEKISTVGLVDTYRITYTNGQTKDYTVTNGEKGDTGNGIDRIELTSTNGSVKTYTIYFTDGNTFEYTVTDGQVTFADLEPLLIKDTVSGDIASFSDGQNVYPLRKCEVTLSPVQDLHGYDKPWVGGAGKNKLDLNVTAYDSNGVKISQEDDGIKIVINNASGYPFTKIGTLPASFPSGTYYLKATQTLAGFGYRVVDRTVSPAVVMFSDSGTIPSGHNELTVEIAGTGSLMVNGTYSVKVGLMTEDIDYSPYSNICPITGWTGCEVINDPVYGGYINWNQLIDPQGNALSQGVTFSVADGKYTVTGTTTGAGGRTSNLTSKSLNVVEGHVYAFITTFEVSGSFDPYITLKSNTSKYMNMRVNRIVTANFSGDSYFGINVANNKVYNSSGYMQLFDLTQMFGAGNEPTTVDEFKAIFPNNYYAYNSGTKTNASAVNGTPYFDYTIPLGQTVYGGTVDLVTGVLTVDRAIDTYDGTEDGWSWYATYQQASIALSTSAKYAVDDVSFISNMFNSVANNQRHLNIGNYCSLVSSGDGVAFSSQATTLDEFKAIISDNPVQFCYELATPTTYQLTGQQIACLLGQNNVWSDGEIEVTYVADTGLYILKKLSE